MVKNGTSTAPAVKPSKPAVEPSKPVVKPSKPAVKPGEKPGVNPGTTPGGNPGVNPGSNPVNPGTNPTVNPGEQVTPELDLDARVEKEISEFMRTGELKDGQFIGLGDGFDEAELRLLSISRTMSSRASYSSRVKATQDSITWVSRRE